jgi:hypothetical protein
MAGSSPPVLPTAPWRGAAAAALLAGCALYLAHVAYAIVANRFFYPDGTEYFVHILATGGYADWLWPRRFADRVLETPLVLAVRAGWTDITVLGWVRGASLMLPAVGSLALCWWAVRRTPWRAAILLPLLSHFAGAANAEFFLHTANRFQVALAWAVVFLLAFRRSPAAWVAAAVLAVPMLRTYESIIFFGPLLAGFAWWRRGRETAPWRRGLLLGLAAWWLLGAALGARFIVRPNDPTSFLTFALGVIAVVDENGYPHLPAITSLTVLAGLAVALRRPAWLARGGRAWGVVVAALAVGTALQPLVWPQALAPEAHQQLRSLNVYLPLALIALLWAVIAGQVTPTDAWWRATARGVAVLTLTQAVWNLQATRHWERYVAIVREELTSGPPGVRRFQDSRLVDLPTRYRLSAGLHCDWSAPHLSLLLAPDGVARVLLAHSYTNLYKPYDPRDADRVPDLSRYGVDVGPFRAGRAAQGEVAIPVRDLPPWLRWLETSFNERFLRRRTPADPAPRT